MADGHAHVLFRRAAVLAAYCDRTVILAAAGATAIHHLVLNFLAPVLVFAGGGELGRVLLHAGILIIETGALVWLTSHLARLFAANVASLADIGAARTREAELARDAKTLSETTRRDTLVRAAEEIESGLRSAIESIGITSSRLREVAKHTHGSASEADEHAQPVMTSAVQAADEVRSPRCRPEPRRRSVLSPPSARMWGE